MDETSLLWINHSWARLWLDVFFQYISWRAGFSFPLLGLLLILLFHRHGADGAKLWLVLALMIGAGEGMGTVLKAVTAQPRPCYALYEQVRQPGQPLGIPCDDGLAGMPSNHALSFFSGAAFMGLMLRRRGLTLGLFAIATLVAVSRVYLGKHFPSQVLAGAAIGTAWGLLVAWLGSNYLSFMQRTRPQRPASCD